MATCDDDASERLNVSGLWTPDRVQLSNTAMTDDTAPAIRTQTEVNMRYELP